jgi:hypothetical protein
MLSASLPSVEAEAEAYEAFNLSPMTVVAIGVGQPSDLCVKNFQRECLGCFCLFERAAGHDAWLAQICDLRLVAAREGIVVGLLGQIDLLGEGEKLGLWLDCVNHCKPRAKNMIAPVLVRA